jgi:hypothetical protein
VLPTSRPLNGGIFSLQDFNLIGILDIRLLKKGLWFLLGMQQIF